MEWARGMCVAMGYRGLVEPKAFSSHQTNTFERVGGGEEETRADSWRICGEEFHLETVLSPKRNAAGASDVLRDHALHSFAGLGSICTLCVWWKLVAFRCSPQKSMHTHTSLAALSAM